MECVISGLPGADSGTLAVKRGDYLKERLAEARARYYKNVAQELREQAPKTDRAQDRSTTSRPRFADTPLVGAGPVLGGGGPEVVGQRGVVGAGVAEGVGAGGGAHPPGFLGDIFGDPQAIESSRGTLPDACGS